MSLSYDANLNNPDPKIRFVPLTAGIDLAKIFEQFDSGEDLAKLVSPAAGECNHPTAVRVNAGGSITEITSAGTRMSAGKAYGRGVRVEIDFAPETKDDPWTLALYFHKGDTYVQILQRRGAERTLATIWRD